MIPLPGSPWDKLEGEVHHVGGRCRAPAASTHHAMTTIVDRKDLLGGIDCARRAVDAPVVGYVLTRSRMDHTWWDALVDATARLDRPTWVVRYAWAWAIVIFDGSDGMNPETIGAALVGEMRCRSSGDGAKCFLKRFPSAETAEHVIRTMDDAVQAFEEETPVGAARLL